MRHKVEVPCHEDLANCFKPMSVAGLVRDHAGASAVALAGQLRESV
jgi:hypothetical protein